MFFILTVAPRAGAWIETSASLTLPSSTRSHPVRVRGLKRLRPSRIMRIWKSHPVRVRGLKRQGDLDTFLANVAPRAGAWIETSLDNSSPISESSHPVRVRGLKHLCVKKRKP